MKKIKQPKKNQKVFYDKESDALWFFLEPGMEVESRKIAPGITAEIGQKGNVIGIEILDVSKVLKPLLEGKSTSTVL